MTIELDVDIASAQERPILEQMLQLYKYDFSELAAIDSPYGELGPDGRFAYPHLASYWEEEDRVPLLTRVNRRLAGFALVSRWSPLDLPTDHAMAEFFVLRKYRRAGIGTMAAREIITRFPGAWTIAVADYNRPALVFWRSALSRVEIVRQLQEHAGDGRRWSGPVFHFTTIGSQSIKRTRNS
jgi:predicted acetyltransferase